MKNLSPMRAIFARLDADDIATIDAVGMAYRSNSMNFRDARGIVSQTANAGRPLQSAEVSELLELADAHMRDLGDAADGLRVRGRAEVHARTGNRAMWAAPHVCIYEPRADDFSEAAASGMTFSVVDRRLFLDELAELEQTLLRVGIRTLRVTCDIEEIRSELALLHGDSRNAADVAAAAEVHMFPRKRADIRRARELGAKPTD